MRIPRTGNQPIWSTPNATIIKRTSAPTATTTKSSSRNSVRRAVSAKVRSCRGTGLPARLISDHIATHNLVGSDGRRTRFCLRIKTLLFRLEFGVALQVHGADVEVHHNEQTGQRQRPEEA